MNNTTERTPFSLVKSERKPPEEVTLIPEVLRKANILQVEIEGDFEPILASINEKLGKNMEPRGDGSYHITVVRPTEKDALRKMDPSKVTELEDLLNEFVTDSDLIIEGVGFIDGSTGSNIQERDRKSFTSYLALSSAKLSRVREFMGLPDFDFHVTLGFEVGDINDAILGTKPTGGLIKGPVEKKPDPSLDPALKFLPDSRSVSGIKIK